MQAGGKVFLEKYIFCSIQFILTFSSVPPSSALDPFNTTVLGTTASEFQKDFVVVLDW